MTASMITARDAYIDSRDVVDRLSELYDLLGDLGQLDRAQMAELASLEALDLAGRALSGDWSTGGLMIREDEFETYARSMVEDCGEIPRNLPSYVVVDWAATARNIRVDYSPIEFEGVTYWIR